MAIATNDGGAHWEPMKLDEHPVSLFFLNDSLGWMVTEKGIWRTDEGGQGLEETAQTARARAARLLRGRE